MPVSGNEIIFASKKCAQAVKCENQIEAINLNCMAKDIHMLIVRTIRSTFPSGNLKDMVFYDKEVATLLCKSSSLKLLYKSMQTMRDYLKKMAPYELEVFDAFCLSQEEMFDNINIFS